MTDTLALLKEVFADVFPDNPSGDNFMNLKIGDFEDWDSLGNYTLLVAIENRFNVHFNSRQLVEINSVTSILEFITYFQSHTKSTNL